MPQVTVRQHVKDQLNDIQSSEDHTSIDSVIRMLLMRSGYREHVEAQETTQ